MGALAGILQFCNSFISMIYNFGKWVVDASIVVGKYLLYWVFDGFYTTVTALLATLNFGNLLVDITSGWGLLSPQITYCVNQVALGSAISMICTAITIRVCLNIIPGIITRI